MKDDFEKIHFAMKKLNDSDLHALLKNIFKEIYERFSQEEKSYWGLQVYNLSYESILKLLVEHSKFKKLFSLIKDYNSLESRIQKLLESV